MPSSSSSGSILLNEFDDKEWKGIRVSLASSRNSNHSSSSKISIVDILDDDDQIPIPPTAQATTGTTGRPSKSTIEQLLFPIRIPIECLSLSEACCCCLLDFIDSDDEHVKRRRIQSIDKGDDVEVDAPTSSDETTTSNSTTPGATVRDDVQDINVTAATTSSNESTQVDRLNSTSVQPGENDPDVADDLFRGESGDDFIENAGSNDDDADVDCDEDEGFATERFRISLSSGRRRDGQQDSTTQVQPNDDDDWLMMDDIEGEGIHGSRESDSVTDDSNITATHSVQMPATDVLTSNNNLSNDTHTDTNSNQIPNHGNEEAGLLTSSNSKSDSPVATSFPPPTEDVNDPVNWIGLISSCKHTFHFECIIRWAARENTCPQCKLRFRVIGVYDKRGQRLRYRYVKKLNQKPAYHEEDAGEDLSDPGESRNPCFICQSSDNDQSTGNVLMHCEGWHGHCDESCHRHCLRLGPERDQQAQQIDFFCPTCIRKNRCINSDGERTQDGRALTTAFQLPSVQQAPTETLALSPETLQIFIDLYHHIEANPKRVTAPRRRANRRALPGTQTTPRRRRPAAPRPRRVRPAGTSRQRTTAATTRRPRAATTRASPPSPQLSVGSGDHSIDDPFSLEASAVDDDDDAPLVSRPVLTPSLIHRRTHRRRARERTPSELAAAEEARALQELNVDEMEAPAPPPMRGVPSDFAEYEEYERRIGNIAYGMTPLASRREDGGVASGGEFLAGLLGSSSGRSNRLQSQSRRRLPIESVRTDQPNTASAIEQTHRPSSASLQFGVTMTSDNQNTRPRPIDEGELNNADRRKRRRVDLPNLPWLQPPGATVVRNQPPSITRQPESHRSGPPSTSQSRSSSHHSNQLRDSFSTSVSQRPPPSPNIITASSSSSSSSSSSNSFIPPPSLTSPLTSSLLPLSNCPPSSSSSSSSSLNVPQSNDAPNHHVSNRPPSGSHHHDHHHHRLVPSPVLVKLVRTQLKSFQLQHDDFKSVCKHSCESLVLHHRHYLKNANSHRQDEFWRLMDANGLQQKINDTILRKIQQLSITAANTSNNHQN